MKEPLTEELLEELLAAPDPHVFAEKHKLEKRTLSCYLQQLLDEKGLERAEVIRRAGLNDTFGYQILLSFVWIGVTGCRKPMKNCIALTRTPSVESSSPSFA